MRTDENSNPRRDTNPLFNDRRLKLGTFGTNIAGGCAVMTTDTTGILQADWSSTTALAKLADDMEFEAVASCARFGLKL